MTMLDTETRQNERRELESDGINTWHKACIGFVAIATVLGFFGYLDYKRINYKGFVVTDEIRQLVVRRAVSAIGDSSIVLDRPGWEDRQRFNYRNPTYLIATLKKPCPEIGLLKVGTPVSIRVIGRKYQERFPTGYYEVVEDPDSLCPKGL